MVWEVMGFCTHYPAQHCEWITARIILRRSADMGKVRIHVVLCGIDHRPHHDHQVYPQSRQGGTSLARLLHVCISHPLFSSGCYSGPWTWRDTSLGPFQRFWSVLSRSRLGSSQSESLGMAVFIRPLAILLCQSRIGGPDPTGWRLPRCVHHRRRGGAAPSDQTELCESLAQSDRGHRGSQSQIRHGTS